MEKLRIVFMGTPDFAVGILDTIYNSKYEIVGVITAPDKPAGRGQKVSISAVKEYALAKKLHLLQPTNLKAPDFLLELEGLQANLQVVVAFRMLPEVVWKMPNRHLKVLYQERTYSLIKDQEQKIPATE
jgi:methionyl-tRNA formyltransferase